ncbi:MAG: hypothetical protein AAFX04_00380 [Pseudomonadota bacterium]
MENWPDWVSAIAALAAILISLWTIYRSSQTEKRTSELESKSADLAKAQTILAQQSWTDEYFREIADWAREVSQTLSNAIHHFEVLEIQNEHKLKILSELSWAIDTGRWYFPNSITDNYGSEKPPAYRGYRQPILDWLVRGYNIVDKPDRFPEAKELLIDVQRNFVSLVQAQLDPRAREESINRILAEFEGIAEMPQNSPPKQG